VHVAIAGPATPNLLLDLLNNTPSGPVPAGSGGTPVNALARALVSAGHRVTLVSLSPDLENPWRAEGPLLGVICRPIRPRARHRAQDFFKLERQNVLAGLREISPDVVHAHWTYEYGCAALASGLPSLVTVHDAPVTILRYHRDVYRLVRLVLACRVRMAGPALTAVSPYAAERWSREMRDSRLPVVIPNLAPQFSVQPRVDRTDAAVVVMLGSAAPLKNIAAGLAAFRLAKLSLPGLQLRVIGPGLANDGEFARAHAGTSPDGVTFVGELESVRVHQELVNASALLHPSLEETQGMVLLEAMRARIPVIAGAESGGVPWTLDDGRAGMLVDVTRPADMSRALVTVLTDGSIADGYVDRASVLLEERFGTDVVTAQYLEAYERVASAAPRS
jgi:glycosyltransferase involved in cell wall biosynthesis